MNSKRMNDSYLSLEQDDAGARRDRGKLRPATDLGVLVRETQDHTDNLERVKEQLDI